METLHKFVATLVIVFVASLGLIGALLSAPPLLPFIVPLLLLLFVVALCGGVIWLNYRHRRGSGVFRLLRCSMPSALLLPLLVLFGGVESKAQPFVGASPQITSFAGFPTFVASNMTTNITVQGVPTVPGRGIAILNAARTVGTENTMMIASFEASTNAPGSSITNWFRPVTPITVTFTNNGVSTTNYGYGLIPASSVDHVTMIRPFSLRTVIGTNGWTNLTFCASAL